MILGAASSNLVTRPIIKYKVAMQNIPWQYLKKGDVVDIIAPSSTVPSNNLPEYYEKAANALKEIGLIARIPENLIEKDKDIFSSNHLDYRVQHFIQCLNDPESKAIWAIRGGYGSAKIIPFLEKISSPRQNKLLLGFSDITALHLFLEKKWSFTSIHSAVINQVILNFNFLKELEPILFGKVRELVYDQLIPLNEAAKQKNIIKAKISGGNLSLVQTSLATSWQIEGKGRIIFLEDVGEEGYRIDRMLNHLLQAGIFAEAKAIIFGEFTPPKNIEPDLCGKAIENFAAQLNIPVLSLPIIGHNIKHNSPLPLGTDSVLELGDKIRITCSTGGTK